MVDQRTVENNKAFLCNELQELIPTKVVMFPVCAPLAGITLYPGLIGISKRYLHTFYTDIDSKELKKPNKTTSLSRKEGESFEEIKVTKKDNVGKEGEAAERRKKATKQEREALEEKKKLDNFEYVNAAKVLLIILHELAHLKRYLKQVKKRYFDRTPEMFEEEAGHYLEKKIFGLKLGNLLNYMDAGTAERILNPRAWRRPDSLKEIAKHLKQRSREENKESEDLIDVESSGKNKWSDSVLDVSKKRATSKAYITPFDNIIYGLCGKEERSKDFNKDTEMRD
jgi:hypothetical protein